MLQLTRTARSPLEALAFIFLLLLGIPVAAIAALVRTSTLKGEIEQLRRDVGVLNRRVEWLTGRLRDPDAEPPESVEPKSTAVDTQGERITSDRYRRPDLAMASRLAEPKPTEPKPSEPEPSEPEPAEPKPTEQDPAEPGPVETVEAGDVEPAEALADAMEDAAADSAADARTEKAEAAEPPPPPPDSDSEDAAAQPESQNDGPGADRATLDLETLIGSTWLLRAGLGILAIALALFARAVAPQLPNIAKVVIAYAGSAAFFGVGKYFEDRLDRFARPVMAGGLAFGFFVAFAAYFVPAMRAVPMGVSIGWMVLSMFTVLVAAERWDSEPTAILAIVLGHVAAQVSAGAAELYSLVLIAFLGVTAILLLLRHSWVTLGLVGVAGAYGAHVLLFATNPGQSVTGGAALGINLGFLTSYYLIFLVADVLWWRRDRPEAAGTDDAEGAQTTLREARILGPANLMLYVGITTVLLFATGSSFEQMEWFYLTLGGFQGVLGWVYRQADHDDHALYPIFGTVLWTIGLFAALDALVLNMVLAAQALILLLAAHRTDERAFYWLAQVAMAVTFVHYVAYPPPAAVTLPVFAAGLAVASVYFAKGAIEEKWYGAESPLPAVHAILGTIVLLREAIRYYGDDPTLGFFLLVAQLTIVGVAAAASSTNLLVGLTTLAVTTPFVVAELLSSSPLTALPVVLGLAGSATLIVHVLWDRFDDSQRASTFWQAYGAATMAMISGWVAWGALDADRIAYLLWMILPATLLLFHRLAELRHADAELSEHPPGVEGVPFERVSIASCIAVAALVVAMTARAIGPEMEAPLWVATWTLFFGIAAQAVGSRSIGASSYTVLVVGYLTLLLGDGIGLLRVQGTVHPALETWWAALYLIGVALAAAVALDRAVESESDPQNEQDGEGADDDEEVASVTDAGVAILTGVPYLLALTTTGTAGLALLGSGWGLVLPGLLAVLLIWYTDPLETPTAVPSAALWLGLAHLSVLDALALRMGGALDVVLWHVLAFSILTLVAERRTAMWAEGRWEAQPLLLVSIALVVMPTLTAMTAIAGSNLTGGPWTTAGWSLLGGSMMAAGFVLRSSIHRRVALGLLGICIVRVFVVDTVGLSDTARIGAFFMLGVVLVGIALLYTKYSEELKSWL